MRCQVNPFFGENSNAIKNLEGLKRRQFWSAPDSPYIARLWGYSQMIYRVKHDLAQLLEQLWLHGGVAYDNKEIPRCPQTSWGLPQTRPFLVQPLF